MQEEAGDRAGGAFVTVGLQGREGKKGKAVDGAGGLEHLEAVLLRRVLNVGLAAPAGR
jgi:hypothetical protein